MKLGMALAGGGIRGSAHLGIITALEEEGIVADMYAGTSAGAIVASFKAMGASNDECLEILSGMNGKFVDIAWWNICKTVWKKFSRLDGFLKGDALREFLNEKTKGVSIASVQKPLAIVSSDVNSASQVVFTSERLLNPSTIDNSIIVLESCTSIPLYEMIYASSSIPALYTPISHDGMKLVDGSVTNNLPANTLREMGATHIIAIDLVNRSEYKEVKGIWEILNRSISLMIEQNMDLSIKGIESCIQMNPHIKDVGLLDFHKLKQTYEEGYMYGKKLAPTIKILLKD